MSELPIAANVWRNIMNERIFNNSNDQQILRRTRNRNLNDITMDSLPPPPKINIPINRCYKLSSAVTDNKIKNIWKNNSETYVGLNKLHSYPPNQQKYLIMVNGGIYDARMLNYMYMLNNIYHIPIKLPHTMRSISDNNHLKKRIRNIMQNNI